MQKQNGTGQPATGLTRRGLLKNSSVAAGAAATFAALGTNFAWAQVSEEIKVGVIGAGGRASGAVKDHSEAAKALGLSSKVVSVCDMFPNKAKSLADKWKVPADKAYSGFDGYKQVIDSGVELILTATPPGFRPIHAEAAVAAGKHIFFEKPVAVDPVGCRRIIAAGKVAKEKGLAMVTGTQRRHQGSYQETLKRIHDGMIGEVLHMSVYWNGGGIWWRKREPGMTDIEAQIHNWYHHIWLSGDQIVEQHIHNIDVANWVLGGPPVSAYALGGRQTRDKMGQPGEIWDHQAVEYEYANGARVFSMSRHWPKADDRVAEFCIGTKGTATPGGSIQVKGGESWRYNAKEDKDRHQNAYVQEHINMLKSIKDGKPLNEAEQIAHSTLTAIIGRMSAYSGKVVKFDWALNQSKLDLVPHNPTKDTPAPAVVVPQPGEYVLI